MSEHPASPELSIGAICADAAGRLAAVLTGGRTHTCEVLTGRHLATLDAAGPAISLSPSGRWLAATDGSVRPSGGGGILWRAPPSGLVHFTSDEELLVIGPGQLAWLRWREGGTRALIRDDRLDPSGLARLVFGPGGRVALIDPAGEAPVLIDLEGERLVALEGRPGPAMDATFCGGELTAVVDGGLSTWDGEGRLLSSLRPHGAQTLAVSARGRELVSAGLEASGRFTLRIASAVLPLPDRAPPSPRLVALSTGWAVDLWSGVVVAGPEGMRHHLGLPPGKDGARPFRAARPLAAAGDHLLLACDPPFVYDAGLGFISRLDLPG